MAQFARPTGDVSTGSWTTTPLWSKVDETPYSDTDYIQAVNVSANSCEFQLSSVTDPQLATGHIVRIRAKKAGSGTISLTGFLYEGTTLRATIAITLTTSYATTEYTLTAAEANAITNYADLHLRLTATCAATSRYVYCSWVEIEIPDVPATPLVIQDVSQTQTAENATLTAYVPHFTLTIQDVSQGQGPENVILTAHEASTPLIIQDVTQSQAAESPGLTQHNVLSIVNTAQSQMADSPGLTQHNVLSIADATQSQAADAPELNQRNVLSIVDATQGQTTENMTLTPHAPGGVTLVIQDVSQSQTAETLGLTQHHILSIANAGQGQSAENMSLTPHEPGGIVLVIQDVNQGQMAEAANLVQHHILTIQDAQQLQTAGLVDLSGGQVPILLLEGIFIGFSKGHERKMIEP